jgi:phosphoglycolate phosphatase-like HAD superfamily hydrolase
VYSRVPKLVLFDIDGTLVLTGGAGLRAMNHAIEQVLGHADGLTGSVVAGRTDLAILDDAVRVVNRELDEALLANLRDRYLAHLAIEIEHPGRGVKGVMPGINELLGALEARGDSFLGLLTGNFEEGARLKLSHFNLWRYFPCGAFGGDSSDRNALVPFALARAQARGLPEISASDVLVVGDTPHDVACAHAAGATPVGVATGSYTVEQLRESGAGIVFEDLSDTLAFLKLLDR